jgi:ABC-type multidrug transport system fused ATPase/permease subunit
MQETYLFKGTIRENLLFGNLEATDKDMVDVAKMAGIYDWIQQQPKGFDQDLSEGTRISLGQKQRFGLARALVRNPRLLILDEPTSSLDSESEQQLLETLKDVGKDRTIIMVSHRLNTVVDADQILVMSNGHVIERGTNAELLALDGKYAEMFRLYFGLGDDDEVMEAA